MSWVRMDAARPSLRFSAVEIVQILVAVGALTLAFFLALAGGIFGAQFLYQDSGVTGVLILLVAAFVAVITAFLLHELAHKVVAQRYGCAAEFRYSLSGLGIGIATAAFGFMFAAPGAVVIAGNVNPRQNVRISAAGPGTNLALAIGFIGISFWLRSATFDLAALGAVLTGAIAFVNVFLGIFNLLPFPPLDGSKIFAFDRPVWIVMIVAAAALYFAGSFLRVFPGLF